MGFLFLVFRFKTDLGLKMFLQFPYSLRNRFVNTGSTNAMSSTSSMYLAFAVVLLLLFEIYWNLEPEQELGTGVSFECL